MKSKKIISLLTAIVLCSGVGTAVLADETDAAADAQTETVTEAASDDVTETEEAAPAEDTADDTAVPEEETAPADDTPVVDTSAIEAVAEKADAIEDSDALLEDENVLYAYSGSCGPTLNYTFDEGVLTISGTGEISSYPWNSFRSDIQQLVIEPG
ncbi:MAG: hypothetical protein IKR73_01835, partial [Oscillospiraceae bacterium]|nr:hypothetical protein [Oscillospiraceae bacterium]